jgi:hypothetical protein
MARVGGAVLVGRSGKFTREALVRHLHDELVHSPFGHSGVFLEYQFDDPSTRALPSKKRKWAWDICIPHYRVAVEVQGYYGGGHHGARGYREDCEKFSEAAAQGWLVLPVTYEMLRKNFVFALVKRAVESTARWQEEFGREAAKS